MNPAPNFAHNPMDSHGFDRVIETAGAWLLALLWILPLAYAVWTAFHPAEFSTRFDPAAPLTLENFRNAWNAAPFARYFLNTTILVTMVLAAQVVVCTLAAYAFARTNRSKETGFVAAIIDAHLDAFDMRAIRFR